MGRRGATTMRAAKSHERRNDLLLTRISPGDGRNRGYVQQHPGNAGFMLHNRYMSRVASLYPSLLHVSPVTPPSEGLLILSTAIKDTPPRRCRIPGCSRVARTRGRHGGANKGKDEVVVDFFRIGLRRALIISSGPPSMGPCFTL